MKFCERLCSSDGFCGASEQEARAHITCRLANGNFGADSLITLEFIAPHMKACGDGPIVL